MEGATVIGTRPDIRSDATGRIENGLVLDVLLTDYNERHDIFVPDRDAGREEDYIQALLDRRNRIAEL